MSNLSPEEIISLRLDKRGSLAIELANGSCFEAPSSLHITPDQEGVTSAESIVEILERYCHVKFRIGVLYVREVVSFENGVQTITFAERVLS
jgi:hypothetical protein